MWRVLSTLVALASASGFPEESWTPAPQGGPDGNLLLTHVLFRHGQRVPKAPYPTDPHVGAALWDDGFSQLTGEGRRQGLALGVGLRRRYGALLPAVRAWRSVRAQSSQVPRTMMTAAAALAGLLPPNGTDRWSELAWQPAPVYSQSPEHDRTLAGALRCPRLDTLLAAHERPSRETRELRTYLERHAGRPVRSANAVEKLYTCMEIERQAGLAPPAWASRVFPEPMRSEAGRALGRCAASPQAARLRAGPLLQELLAFDASDVGAPLRLYCTHDNVLAGLLGALGLYSGKPPGFAAALALEYRAGARGDVHVQLWARDAAGEPLERLALPGCGERCPLGRFRELLLPLVPEDWAAECAVAGEVRRAGGACPGWGWWLTVGGLVSCAALGVLAVCHVMLRKHEYERLPESSPLTPHVTHLYAS